MLLQRVLVAEKGRKTDCQMDRGGRSQRLTPSILRRAAYVSCRGYVCTLLKVHGFAVNQGGTADMFIRP